MAWKTSSPNTLLPRILSISAAVAVAARSGTLAVAGNSIAPIFLPIMLPLVGGLALSEIQGNVTYLQGLALICPKCRLCCRNQPAKIKGSAAKGGMVATGAYSTANTALVYKARVHRTADGRSNDEL